MRREQKCRHVIATDDSRFAPAIVTAFRRALKSSKRSRRDFAHAIGVAPAALTLILAGDAEPSAGLLLRAAEVAEQPVAAILGEVPLIAQLQELEGKIMLMEALLKESGS